MPALFTSTSMCPPSSSIAVSQMSRGAAGLVRSPAMRVSLPFVEWPTTLWPCCLRSVEAAAPIPRLAPVIRMFMSPAYRCKGGGGRSLSCGTAHEGVGARLEAGDLLGEAPESLLHL